jgi:UTP--glucose-1-phosphate uridylyltransferase
MSLTQAILPVAGLGTRFLPWTKVVPKELLPIGSQPIIGLLVDECLSVGVKDICFVISRGKESIPQYFEKHPELEKELDRRGKSHLLEELNKYDEVRFHTVYQEEMKGDGHAILQAQGWVESDMLAVLFGDDLIVGPENGLQQLAKAWKTLEYAKDAALLCVQDVERSLVSKYGIIDIAPDKHADRMHRVTDLVEKPKPEEAPSTLGIVGKYLVPRIAIDELATIGKGGHDGEVRLIDALKSLLAAKKIEIYGYEFEGRRFDTGTPEGYKEAVRILG